jgi:hypothetical protein
MTPALACPQEFLPQPRQENTRLGERRLRPNWNSYCGNARIDLQRLRGVAKIVAVIRVPDFEVAFLHFCVPLLFAKIVSPPQDFAYLNAAKYFPTGLATSGPG